MHLLKTSAPFTLCTFSGTDIPDYAILSHRWVQTEVSFQLMQSWNATEPDRDHPSFAKISGCCEQAREDGWEYVWIDTCCIDKTSSHELSEAINSMYRYYRNAQVCYAYLYDVPGGSSWESLNAFCKSDWFKRGWTLQELLAPHTVIFFDYDWVEIGTRSSLRDEISRITQIKRPFHTIQNASVAEKMSWASSRNTERNEDIAYCLLGLFDIYMTPIYGEGENAFRRLQLEIMNKLNDESIFAWTDKSADSTEQRGLLARSPDVFADCGSIEPGNLTFQRPPYSMTNRGLMMEFLLFKEEDINDEFVAVLDCQEMSKVGVDGDGDGDGDGEDEDEDENDNPPKILGIYVQKVAENCYSRIRCSSLKDCSSLSLARARRQVLFIQQDDPTKYISALHRRIFVDADSALSHGFLVESEHGTFDANGQLDLQLSTPRTGKGSAIFTFHDQIRMETFALIVDLVDGHLGVNIVHVEGKYLVPPRVRDFLDSKYYRKKQPHRLDRVSRKLLSDRYVSVRLHPAKLNDLKRHVVKLFIHQERPERLPDMEPAFHIPADAELEEVVELARQREYLDTQSMEDESVLPPPYALEDSAQMYADATYMDEDMSPSREIERRNTSSPEAEDMEDESIPPPPYALEDFAPLVADATQMNEDVSFVQETERRDSPNPEAENITESLYAEALHRASRRDTVGY